MSLPSIRRRLVAEVGRERRADIRADRLGPAANLNGTDREDGGLTRRNIGADSETEEREPDEDRAT